MNNCNNKSCRLCGMIEHAYNTVTFYRNSVDISSQTIELRNDPLGFLKTLPIIEKDDIKNNLKAFISDSFADTVNSNNTIIKTTSGSTGKCLSVYWSRQDDLLTNYNAWKYRNKWYGVTTNDKYATFHTTFYVGNRFVADKKIMVKNEKHISFNKTMLSKSTCNDYIRSMNSFGVSVLLTQPSTLELLINSSNKESLCILRNLKYIELIGEYCSLEFLEYVKKELPSVFISNMYGTTETGYVALTCRYGHQHVLDNAIVEVLNEDNVKSGSKGVILLTSLTNHTMPFIRYNIGDIGILKKSSCPCGMNGDELIILQGRESDRIQLPNNDEKSAYSLWYSIEKINSEFGNPIISYHFIQKSKRSIVAYLSIKKEYLLWSRSIETALIETLKNDICSNIDFAVLFVDYSFNSNKKMSFFESQIHL